MKLIQGVYDISTEFLQVPKPIRRHVTINEQNLQKLVDKMTGEGKVNFFDEEPQEFTDVDERKLILRELVASSINYNYWYGTSLIRPGGASSSLMYELVDDALLNMTEVVNNSLTGDITFAAHIDQLIELLSANRFPLLEERKRHLLELVNAGLGVTFARYVQMNKDKPYDIFKALVNSFQGFASDIFLKRASLFMIQLFRQRGWFEDFMGHLFVPADYQVPKMLNHFKVLEYSNGMIFKIQESKLIEKGSLMECQLRAATIIACKMICLTSGWNISEVDTWLWTKRKEPKSKFHLTYTTDY